MKTSFFNISFYLSIFYLVLIAMTVVLEPFTKVPVIQLYTSSNYWLGPVQGIVAAALGVLFVTQDNLKAGEQINH